MIAATILKMKEISIQERGKNRDNKRKGDEGVSVLEEAENIVHSLCLANWHLSAYCVRNVLILGCWIVQIMFIPI